MTAGKVIPVILSGGAGTRLWPLSCAARPKHLLEFEASESLFVRTVRRTSASGLFGPPLVVCNNDHRFLIAEQLREFGLASRSIILEPVGRNTAPAVAVACLLVHAEDPDATVMALPSDHLVRDVDAFYDAAKVGLRAAEQGALVVFGVTPHGPATGFGYIRRGDPLLNSEGVFAVDDFVEKPPKEIAQDFITSGRGLWNSGIFLFRADRYLEELETWSPAMLAACRAAVAEIESDEDFLRLPRERFEAAPSLPVDKAVMERTNAAAVVPVDLGWSDIGSWAALWEVGEKGASDNVTIGNVVTRDTKRCYVRSDGRVVATVGIEDMVVVATEDAVLVTPLDRSQDVKAIVEQLNARRSNEPHKTEVLRPWGSYKSINAGEGFQVKWLKIKPRQRLSSQSHVHRSEHWVVVEGTACVTLDDAKYELYENESAFIPAGMTHRLENPTDQPLTVIEVQCGEYLGEDDIVRFEDDYDRPIAMVS